MCRHLTKGTSENFHKQICEVRTLHASWVGITKATALQREHKKLSLDMKNKVFILASKDIHSAVQGKETVFFITGWPSKETANEGPNFNRIGDIFLTLTGPIYWEPKALHWIGVGSVNWTMLKLAELNTNSWEECALCCTSPLRYEWSFLIKITECLFHLSKHRENRSL